MSGAVKTALIVGGVGVGAFLLVRALTPTPATQATGAKPPSQLSTPYFLGGMIPGALSSFLGMLNSPAQTPVGVATATTSSGSTLSINTTGYTDVFGMSDFGS